MNDDDRTGAADATPDRPPGRWSATLNRTYGVVERWSAAGTSAADRIRSAAGPTGAGGVPIWRTTSRALAVAGALVGAGSIGGDWIRFEIPGVTIDGNDTASMMVAELGSYGTAYLVGFLALVVAAALALFGTTRIRTDVRVGALALGVGLLTLLAVVAMNADGLLRTTFRIGPDLIVQTTVGPGLTAAAVSVGAFLAAVHLSGWAASTPPTSPTTASGFRDAQPGYLDGGEDTQTSVATGADGGGGGASGGAAGRGGGGDPVGLPWHRPEQPTRTLPEPEPGPPADLTVSPTEPFVRPENPPPQTRRW